VPFLKERREIKRNGLGNSEISIVWRGFPEHVARHNRSPRRESWVLGQKSLRGSGGRHDIEARFKERFCVVLQGLQIQMHIFPALTCWATIVARYALRGQPHSRPSFGFESALSNEA